jgi:hypothetical protein
VPSTTATRPPLGDQVGHLGEAIRRLVVAHVALARAEATERLRASGRDLAFVAAGAGLLAAGWLLLAVAVGLGLGDRIGMARGFLVVAAVHVATGGLLAGLFGRRLTRGDRPSWPVTRAVVRRDRAYLGELVRAWRRPTPHAP